VSPWRSRSSRRFSARSWAKGRPARWRPNSADRPRRAERSSPGEGAPPLCRCTGARPTLTSNRPAPPHCTGDTSVSPRWSCTPPRQGANKPRRAARERAFKRTGNTALSPVRSDARTSAPLRLPQRLGHSDGAGTAAPTRARRTLHPSDPHSTGDVGALPPAVAPRDANSPGLTLRGRSRDPHDPPGPPVVANRGPVALGNPLSSDMAGGLAPRVLARTLAVICTRRQARRRPLDGSVRIRATCGSGTSAGL
jgi:hypothetical protein